MSQEVALCWQVKQLVHERFTIICCSETGDWHSATRKVTTPLRSRPATCRLNRHTVTRSSATSPGTFTRHVNRMGVNQRWQWSDDTGDDGRSRRSGIEACDYHRSTAPVLSSCSRTPESPSPQPHHYPPTQSSGHPVGTGTGSALSCRRSRTGHAGLRDFSRVQTFTTGGTGWQQPLPAGTHGNRSTSGDMGRRAFAGKTGFNNRACSYSPLTHPHPARQGLLSRCRCCAGCLR
jgi:hypothetical protein